MSDEIQTNEKRLTQYRERRAEEAVDELIEDEVDRRKYCVEVVSESMNLEVTEANLFELADKVYEYVWGKKQP